jgi:hypothetical protein
MMVHCAGRGRNPATMSYEPYGESRNPRADLLVGSGGGSDHQPSGYPGCSINDPWLLDRPLSRLGYRQAAAQADAANLATC